MAMGPTWYSVSLLAALPAAFIYMLMRMARHMRHRNDASPAKAPVSSVTCPHCGYDLRATPHLCPECGTIIVNWREYLLSLANDWPNNAIDPRIPQLHEAPVILLSTSNSGEARMLNEQLNARGIFCRLAYSEPIGGQSKIVFTRVMVYSSDLEIAKAYLRRAQGLPAQLDEGLRIEVIE
jgi:hypothetical protein